MTTSIDTAREDPLVGFHFLVDLEQAGLSGYFTEVSGLGSETETIEHKVVNGGVEVVMQIPGRLKWDNITLKRGITSNMDLWGWRAKVENGQIMDARSDGSVVMFDQALTEVARWNFQRAWPSKISGPSVKSDANEIGVEELTLVHEGITRVN